MNEPMPPKLQVITWFKVIDSNGQLLRSEELPAGADLPDRLRLAHRNYPLLRMDRRPAPVRAMELPRREGGPAPPDWDPTARTACRSPRDPWQHPTRQTDRRTAA
jgi:hypothetical protein